MIDWTCYQPHFYQTHLWQFPLPQNAKCFLKFVVNWPAWQQGSHRSKKGGKDRESIQSSTTPDTSSVDCNTALVIYWVFGDPKLSYTCAFWESFLNIDTNQRYLSKYDNMLVVLYGNGNVAVAFALNFCWFTLLHNCH